MVGFILSRNVPQDAATALVNMRGGDVDATIETYEAAYKELGLDKPDFYFSLVPNTYPRTLNVISSSEQRKRIKKLLAKGIYFSEISKNLYPTVNEYDQLKKIEELQLGHPSTSSSLIYPRLYWHGTNNQYHSWWKSLIKGSFGKSIVNGQEATAVVRKALTWTAFIGLGAIFFSFTLGIFIGIWLAKNTELKSSRMVSNLLYFLYSIPIFWIATLFVIYLTTDDYGSWTNIFPSVGIEVLPGESTFNQVLANIHKFILPIICGSFATIAFIARMLRRSILNEMQLPYIITAYSKGLSPNEVLMRHALPNALLPLITIFVGAIPATIGGSVVLEVIFNIPGMGRLLINSIGVADWNVVFCILMLTGLITIVSYLIGDILYAYFNPKIRFA